MVERELKCPVCGEAMGLRRQNDVTIDVCRRHGVWLDSGELEAILRSALAIRDDLQRARKAAAEGRAHAAAGATEKTDWEPILSHSVSILDGLFDIARNLWD